VREDRRSPAERTQGIRLVVLGTLLFSTSAVLVRSAEGFTPLEVASYRLILGAAFIALFALAGGQTLNPFQDSGSKEALGDRRDAAGRLWALAGAGAAAAVHFAFYIASLYWTSIAHSLVLVNLSPVLALPLAVLFLGESFELRRVPGVLLTIAGLAVMVGLEPRLTPRMLVGDLMALAAALAYAVYSVIGRTQRAGAGLLPYTFWVYLTAGACLLAPALWQAGWAAAGWAAGPGRLSAAGVAAVVLLALLPTAGGHTLYNAALRRADAVTVNLIATQEVTGGVLLGALLLGEVPSLETVLGGAVALGGLWLVLRK